MMNGRLLRASLRKWRRIGGTKETLPSASYEHCCCCPSWATALWWPPRMHEEDEFIPKDVPKGHLVVYVGEAYKRFVIKVTLLKHPLFRALLDQAKDEYGGFTPPDSKLCIPCDENIFLDVLRCCCANRRICRL